MRNTPQEVRDRSTQTTIRKIEKIYVRRGSQVRVVAKIRTNSQPGVPPRPVRTVLVESVSGGHLLHTAHIKVSCSCEYWKWYGCADVLNMHGAAFVRDVTGYMPLLRNPAFTPSVCKHVYRILRQIQLEKK
jgi:hypothetical protein